MRLRHTVLTLLLAALGSMHFIADAQEWRGGKARAEGMVKNKSGEPIAEATVKMRWGESGHGGPDLKTDKKGRWAVFGLQGGVWNLDFEAAGYLPKKISVNLSEAGRNPLVEIQLEPELQQQQAREQIVVGGKTISKEVAEAIEKGNAAFSDNKYAEARENYLKALGELPDSEPLLMRLAAAYEAEGNDQEALKYAHQAAERNPQDANPWLMIATIELQNGNLDAGNAALAKVSAEKVVDPQLYMNMGIVLTNKKKPAEAEAAFTKALAIKSDLPDAYYLRGLARLQQNHKQDAKADFQKYLELAPDGKESKDVKELLNAIK